MRTSESRGGGDGGLESLTLHHLGKIKVALNKN